MIAEVVFNVPLDRSFHYLIPASLADQIEPGVRVIAPFGSRDQVGMVITRLSDSPIAKLKPIRQMIDASAVITGERWALARWITDYYCCSLGEALAAMVPSAIRVGPDAAATTPGRRDGKMASVVTAAPRPVLTPAQEQALGTIMNVCAADTFGEVLIHGVTGSGKTEVYLRVIEAALAAGRGALYLIPEIALTPQTVERLHQRFGERVVVWHSRLTATQRRSNWTRLACGDCQVVVGARSAVFAPVQRLGVIVVDEEQETSYKQEAVPHVHAREVARARARLAQAVLVLGSATPSIESYYQATQPGGRMVVLPERVQGRPLPRVELIDLRDDVHGRRRAGAVSVMLQRALEQTVARNEQAMLLLNRRGFARSAQCQLCGAVKRCAQCSVPLIYHAGAGQLICHYCNRQEQPPTVCDVCHKGYLKFRGSGTERIESELHRLFPTESIARMDRDTTKDRQSHHRLYQAVKNQQVRLLVGTQMIAKGFDFPQVTLVGVVSADTELNLPDFRAGERTFDLLTQVAGRAGRGDQPGRVLVQTYCPDHYAIQAARQQDYLQFYREEITMRRRLGLPPFLHLIELTVIGGSSERVGQAAGQLAERLRQHGKSARISLLGPAPHRIPRLRRAYRMCLMLKGRAVEPMVVVLRQVLQPGRKFAGLPVKVNVDPL